jgi:hypothetical protein
MKLFVVSNQKEFITLILRSKKLLFVSNTLPNELYLTYKTTAAEMILLLPWT